MLVGIWKLFTDAKHLLTSHPQSQLGRSQPPVKCSLQRRPGRPKLLGVGETRGLPTSL
jgi:hypothetical protein